MQRCYAPVEDSDLRYASNEQALLN